MRILIFISILIFGEMCYAQTDITDTYIKHISANPIEIAYLHLDKELFFTGDSVYLSGLITDFVFRPSSSISQVVKVTLIDDQKKRHSTSFFKNENGSFCGKFLLPHSIKSGNYFLAAHTSYMDNFDETLQDLKPIFIKNLWDEFSLNSDYSVARYSQKEIAIYPEVGAIIPDLNQKIIFETPVADKFKQSTAKLYIDNKLLLETPVENFTGQFYLKPQKGIKYRLSLVDGQESEIDRYSFQSEENFAIKTSKVGSNIIVTVIKPSDDPSSSHSLVLESNQKLKSIFDIKFTTGNTTSFSIPINSLDGNFHSFVLINKNKQVLTAKAFFIKPSLQLDIKKKDSISTNSNQKIQVKTEDMTNILVSLGRSANTNMLSKKIAATYMNSKPSSLLSTSYYQLTVEDFLSTQILNLKNKWTKILNSSPEASAPSIRPELGIDIRGEIAGSLTKEAIVHIYQNKSNIAYQVEVDSSNQFYLPIADFEGTETFLYALTDKKGNDIPNKLSFSVDKIEIPEFSLLELKGDSSIAEQMTINRIAAQFLINAGKKEESLYEKLPSDLVLDMDDYVVLDTFEEVVEDILTLVSVKRTKGKKHLRMDVPSMSSSYFSKPTIIVDNSLIDSELIWEITPLHIAEIKLLHNPEVLAQYGGLGIFGGIIGIKLKPNAPQSLLLKVQDSKLKLNGYNLESSVPPVGYPNFKSTLLNISSSAQYDRLIQYKSSNLTGQFYLNIEGLSENGEILNYSHTIYNLSD